MFPISALIILILSFSLIRLSVVQILSSIAEKTHNVCLSFLPSQINHKSELGALVCAQNFSHLGESNLYITSGLIHLFVVSGSHLIVLESLFRKAKLPDHIILTTLIVYGFACDLNAPVVRCLVAYVLNYLLQRKNIIWPAHFKLLIIGATTLSLNPIWITSLSLQMSWIAAFMVMLGKSFFKSTSLLFKQGLIFFGLLPTFVFFQVPSPIIILINLILTPVLEFILFPIALLTFVFHFLSPVFDWLIEIFKLSLTLLELDFNFQMATAPPEIRIYNWCLIFILHFIFHILYVYKKRTHIVI